MAGYWINRRYFLYQANFLASAEACARVNRCLFGGGRFAGHEDKLVSALAEACRKPNAYSMGAPKA